MRVLMVNKFYDLRGGTERVMFDLGAGLVERGHELIPFATRDERNLPTPYASYFAAHRDYGGGGARARLAAAMGTVWDRGARRSLERLLDEHPCDVAHLHNIYHQLSPSILAPLRERHVPVLMTLHDYKLACPTYRMLRQGSPCELCVGRSVPWGSGWHVCSRGSRAESWLLTIESTLHRLGRVYRRGVDCFVSPSRFLADVMRRAGLPGDRLRVIPNAPRERGEPAPAVARSARPTVLYAGRLSEEKGVDVLVEAVRGRPEIELRVAGDGPEDASLRGRARGLANVCFLGRLDAAALAGERARAWALALPALWYENAPLAVLEAYASRRPVLASALGGLPEMVEDGETGWLLPGGDVEAWGAALEELARDAEEADRRGDRGHRRLRERYDYPDFLDAYERLYGELVGGGGLSSR